jgi:hypothetical protein
MIAEHHPCELAHRSFTSIRNAGRQHFASSPDYPRYLDEVASLLDTERQRFRTPQPLAPLSGAIASQLARLEPEYGKAA